MVAVEETELSSNVVYTSGCMTRANYIFNFDVLKTNYLFWLIL